MDLANVEPDQLARTQWGLETCRHILHAHYYFERVGVKLRRDQDLHDRDKLLDDVVKNGLALEYCRGRIGYENCDDLIERAIQLAVKKHRNAWAHHLIWAGKIENPRPDDYMEGAVDIVVTILEKRLCYVRMGISADSLEEISSDPEKFIVNFKNGDNVDKLPYVRMALSRMREIEKPELGRIVTLQEMPNIGVCQELYERLMWLRDLELLQIRDMKRVV